MSSAPDRQDPALPDLVERWVAGWVVARRLPPPDRVGDALRVEVGHPGRRFEFVIADDGPAAGVPLITDRASSRASTGGGASITDVAAAAIGTPGRNWVTVVTTHPDALVAPLHAVGLSVEGDIEWMMWIDLSDQAVRPAPSPYRVEVDREGDVIVASAFDVRNELAASGRMSLTATDAIADRILTVPGHRRQGLGAAVMGALVAAALAEGASTGILAASIEGERLYSALGWHGIARLVVGRTEDG